MSAKPLSKKEKAIKASRAAQLKRQQRMAEQTTTTTAADGTDDEPESESEATSNGAADRPSRSTRSAPASDDQMEDDPQADSATEDEEDAAQPAAAAASLSGQKRGLPRTPSPARKKGKLDTPTRAAVPPRAAAASSKAAAAAALRAARPASPARAAAAAPAPEPIPPATPSPAKKIHWKTAAKAAADAAAAAAAAASKSPSKSRASSAAPASAASSSKKPPPKSVQSKLSLNASNGVALTHKPSATASATKAKPASSAAAAAQSSPDASASPSSASASPPSTPVKSEKSALALQRARETRDKKAASSAARVAARAATMAKKAEAKAEAATKAAAHKPAATVAPASAAAACSSSLISTPSFRVVDLAKLSSVLSKLSDSSGLRDDPVEDMSDRAFLKRHRPLEREESAIREEERRDSIVRWAICDAPACRKWRVLPKVGGGVPSDSSIHWFCGGLTSRAGGQPQSQHCSKPDDWIVKCVGARLAGELADVGITTVALFEGAKDAPQHATAHKSAAAASSSPSMDSYTAKMRKLGLYYDVQTQTICKY